MTARFAEVFEKAFLAGLEAGYSALPKPMTVVAHSDPFDDTSPPEKVWHVSEGACGFAWVNVRPGTSSFARWLKKNVERARKSYHGGVDFWISEHGQSVERKSVHADAMAKVLRDELGVKAYGASRLD